MADLRKLYEGVKPHVEIGSFEEFHEALKNPERRKRFYDAVSPYVDLGAYEVFNKKLDSAYAGQPSFEEPSQLAPQSGARSQAVTSGAVGRAPVVGAVEEPKEHSTGEPWKRGIKIALNATAGMFNWLDEIARDFENTIPGLKGTRGGGFEKVENWLREKAEGIKPKPPTGKYAEPPENFLGYFDINRINKIAGENLPLMGSLFLAYLAHPAIALGLTAGIEGGSTLEAIEEYEKSTGKKVDSTYKRAAPLVVGAINAALEKVGFDRILSKLPADAKGKIIRAMLNSMVEGGTEAGEEVTQILAEYGYKVPENVANRLQESFAAGLIFGVAGTTGRELVGKLAENVRENKVAEPDYILGQDAQKGSPQSPSVPAKMPEFSEETSDTEILSWGSKHSDPLTLVDLISELETLSKHTMEEPTDIEKSQDVLERLKAVAMNSPEMSVETVMKLEKYNKIEDVPTYILQDVVLRLAEGYENLRDKQPFVKQIKEHNVGDDVIFYYLEDRKIRIHQSKIVQRENLTKLLKKSVREIEDKPTKLLLKELLPHLDPKAYIYIVEDLGGSAGLYRNIEGSIFIEPRESYETPEEFAYVLMHEATHNATSAPFHKLERGEQLNERERVFVSRMRELYEEALSKAKEKEVDYHYGLTNVFEFVSEALNRRDFMEFLDSIESPLKERPNAPQTLLTKFFELIREFLGLKPEQATILEDAIKSTAEYLKSEPKVTEEAQEKWQDLKTAIEAYEVAIGAPIDVSVEKGIMEKPRTVYAYENIISKKYTPSSASKIIKFAHMQEDPMAWLEYFAGENVEKPLRHSLDMRKKKERIRQIQLALAGSVGRYYTWTPYAGIIQRPVPNWIVKKMDKETKDRFIARWMKEQKEKKQRKGDYMEMREYNDALRGEGKPDKGKSYTEQAKEVTEHKRPSGWSQLWNTVTYGLGKFFLSPEFLTLKEKTADILRKPIEEAGAPHKDAAKLVEVRQAFEQRVSDMNFFFERVKKSIPKKLRGQVKKVMELVYLSRNENAPEAVRNAAERNLEAILKKHPELVEGAEDLIDFFDSVKQEYRDYLKWHILNEIETNKSPQLATAVSFYYTHPELLNEETIEQFFDFDAIMKEKNYKPKGTFKETEKKLKRIRKRLVQNRLKMVKQGIEELHEAENWGVEDFITRIELGAWKVLDEDGRVVAIAKTRRQARKKAYAYRQKTGYTGTLESVMDVNLIDPTVASKFKLQGEENIFDVLPAYYYAILKRMMFKPVFAEIKKSMKESPEYTPTLKHVVNEQMKAVWGRYYLGDRVFDAIAEAFGWQAGLFSKITGGIRTIQARLKLGRPIGGFINAAGGYGHTWVKVSGPYMVKAWKALSSGKIEIDGEVIDVEKFLKEQEEKHGALGMSLAIGESGQVKVKTKWYDPITLFQWPEPMIRRHNLIANYLLAREAEGLSHKEAAEVARRALRFQAFSYNIASIPQVLRGPGLKTVGQFKTYLVKELEFISTLSKRELLRYMVYTMFVTGPRGVVYMLKSLPILAAVGALDGVEKWLVEDDEEKEKMSLADRLEAFAKRGVAGLFGADITAPATFQLPQSLEDWFGPTLSDMKRLYERVAIPFLENTLARLGIEGSQRRAFVKEEFVDWVFGLSPLTYYWEQLNQSIMGWELKESLLKGTKHELDKETLSILERLQRPNVWIRDSQGRLAYPVGGFLDRAMLFLGVAPAKKSEYAVLLKMWQRNEEIMRQNRAKWLNEITDRILKGREVPKELWNDALLYGINPESIYGRLKLQSMTPKQRAVWKASILRKAEALDFWNFRQNQEK